MITGVGVGVARRIPFFFGRVWPPCAGGPARFPVEGGIVRRKIGAGVGVDVFIGPFGGRFAPILGVGVTVGLLEVPGGLGGVGVRVGKFRGVNVGLGKGFTTIGPVG